MSQTAELKVFIPTTEATCAECGDDLGRSDWITLIQDRWETRDQVAGVVAQVLAAWEATK